MHNDEMPNLVTKTFPTTEGNLERALAANAVLGNLWSETEIRGDAALFLGLVVADMMADGMQLKSMAKNLGVCEETIHASLARLRRKAHRRRKFDDAGFELFG